MYDDPRVLTRTTVVAHGDGRTFEDPLGAHQFHILTLWARSLIGHLGNSHIMAFRSQNYCTLIDRSQDILS